MFIKLIKWFFIKLIKSIFMKLIKWSEFYFSSILVYTWLKFDRIEYSIELSNIRSNRTYKKFDSI
jgi:hypothetical protein